MSTRPRIIIASPNLLEGEAVADWVSAEGFDSVRRSTVRAAVDEIQARPFDLLIADAAFAFRYGLHAASRLRRPLTPTVVIGEPAGQSESDSRQVIFLARPVERTLMVCTVCLVIADGRPVRCSARKPVHRFEALVNGVPSHIIDVSNEGLRLEVPRDRRSIPPPYFNVRVPLIGVALTVQRVWARSSDEGTVLTCGGALSQGQAKAGRAWLAFVDTLPKAGGPSLDSLHIQTGR
jgi:hypothetical protein